MYTMKKIFELIRRRTFSEVLGDIAFILAIILLVRVLLHM